MSVIDKINFLSQDRRQGAALQRNAKQLKPLYALAFLTYRCTGNCLSCNIRKREKGDAKRELGIDEWRMIVDRLKQGGVTDLEIFGGDALLRKDVLFDLIAYCRLKEIDTFMPTNCNLFDRDTARLLVEKGLGHIYLSLDGPAQAHDRLRGLEGSYDRVSEAIRENAQYKGKGAGPEIIVNTTISNLNYRYLTQFLEEMKSLPIDGIKFGYLSQVPGQAVQDSAVNGCLPDPYFESRDEESLLLSGEEAGQLRRTIKAIWRSRKSYPFPINLDDLFLIPQKGLQTGVFPQNPCLRSCIEPTVTPDGEILPCPFFSHYSLGNLHKENLETIWGNPSHRAFVRDQRDGKIKICNYCNMLLFKKGISLTIKNTMIRWRYSL